MTKNLMQHLVIILAGLLAFFVAAWMGDWTLFLLALAGLVLGMLFIREEWRDRQKEESEAERHQRAVEEHLARRNAEQLKKARPPHMDLDGE